MACLRRPLWPLCTIRAPFRGPGGTFEPLTARSFTSRPPDQLIKVPIVGRPNVGKSTLFNRFVRHSRKYPKAVVSPMAGTTRDRRECPASIAGADFIAVDTGGLDDDPAGGLNEAIADQVGGGPATISLPQCFLWIRISYRFLFTLVRAKGGLAASLTRSLCPAPLPSLAPPRSDSPWLKLTWPFS